LVKKNSSTCCHVPVSGYMVRQPDGTYQLDPGRSTYADIPADSIARFLLDRLGTNFSEGEGNCGNL